jgi:hypothetical protein
MLIFQVSSLVSGKASKCRKKYCDVYARKLMRILTAGTASCDIEKSSLNISAP